MKKRGLIWDRLVTILLILAVAVFVIGGLLRNIKIGGEEAINKIAPDYGEFEPYQYEPVGEEATVADSVNALVCAINAVAVIDKNSDNVRPDTSFEGYLDQIEWERVCEGGVVAEENQEEGDENTGSGCAEVYGNCVTSLSNDKAHFEEADYEEGEKNTCPPDKPVCEIQCPFEWGKSCNDPGEKKCNNLRERAQFCMESGYWCQKYCAEAGPRTGQCEEEGNDVICSGASYAPLEIEEEIQDEVEESKTKAGCSNGVLYGTSCVQCLANEESRFKCTVNNFFLPQTGAGDSGTLENWVAGLGDPEYLVYYEAFPEGEDEYWKPDYLSYSPLVLYISVGASLLLPVDGDLISDIHKADNYFDIFTKHTLIGKIGKKITNPIVKQAMRVKKGVFLLGLKNPEYVAKLELLEYALRESDDLVVQDSTEFIPILRKYVDEDSLRITDEFALRTELAEEFETQIFLKGGLTAPASSRVPEMAEGLAYDYLSQVKSTMSSSSVDIAKARTARNLGYSLDQFYTNGKISQEALSEYLKDNPKRVEAFVDLLESGKLKEEQLGDYIRVLRDTTDEFSDDWAQYHLIAKNADGQIDIMQALGQNSEKVEEISGKMSRIKGLRAVESMANWGKKVGIAGLSTVDTQNRWFTMAFLYYMGNLIEGVNSKFLPHGANTLVVQSPNMLGRAQEIDMEGTNTYSIILENNEKLGRFYLASPCKADLEITKTEFTYKLSDKKDILLFDLYNFGSGSMPVKKGTLQYEIDNPDIFRENLALNSNSDYDEVIDSLERYDSTADFSGSSKVEEVFRYGLEKFSEQEFKKALNTFMLISKYYPLSEEALESEQFIDMILLNEDMFLTMSQDELREIAFEWFIDEDTRAEQYGKFWDKIGEKIDIGEIYRYTGYDESCRGEELFKDNWEICEFNSKKTAIYEEIMKEEFFVSENHVLLFDMISQRQNRDLYERYAGVLFYVYDDDYFEGSQLFKDLDTFYERKNYYEAAYSTQIEDTKYNDQSNRALFYLGDYLNTYYNSDGSYYGHSWYDSGRAMVPIHIKYSKKELNGQAVSEYPSWITFSNEYVPIYEKFDSDTSYNNDEPYTLNDKKEYIELKASVSSLGLIQEDVMGEQDLRNWILLNSYLQNRGVVDSSSAVKHIDNIGIGRERGTNQYDLSSSGIMVDVNLDESADPNYCYQEFNQVRVAKQKILTATSLFADEVAGTLAAYGCAQFGVTAGAVPWCYRIGSAAANLGLAKIDQKLMEKTKWPLRGD